MKKTSYLYIIICILLSLKGFGQDLTLKINGITKTETAIIDSINYNKKHKNFISIKSEIDSIQNRLLNLGYIESEIKKIKKINDSTFDSKLHLKNKFNTIYIHYNIKDIEQSTLKNVSADVFDEYFILEFSKIKKALAIINNQISKSGQPFIKLKLSNITVKTNSILEAYLTIDSSDRKRAIDNIVIKGYEKFPKSYLKYYLKIKPEQTFNINAIKNRTEQLNNLSFANEIKSPEVLFTKDSTALYLYIEKTKSNNFDGFLGFGTNEETNKLEFDGYLNLKLTNNLNFGESFRLLYKSDENDQKTFETNISLPYIFNTPIGADLLLRIFKKDSSFTTVNQSARLHYQINPKSKIYGGLITTESNNLLTENTSTLISDYKTQHYTIAYQFLKPQSNNILFPLKSKLYLEAGFGERKTNLNTQNQSQYTLESFKIFTLNTKNSIYIRLNGSNLISDTFFENELLRFGGINSIRGFEENSLFASLYGVTNTEYRLKLNNSMYIHTIIDAGYFENKLSETKEKLFAYGFGFGILTKSGLLRFNYANGKNENTPFKLSNSKIHLSLTTNF